MDPSPEPQFHEIRLNGPWTGVAHCNEEQTPFRIKLPDDWTSAPDDSFSGQVVLTRSFGGPSGLGLNQPVFLAIDQVDSVDVELNGNALGSSDCGKFMARIDQIIQRSNRLILSFKSWNANSKTLRGICLRIQED